MSPALWLVFAVVAFVLIGATQLVVRKLIERAGRRLDGEPAPDPDSWAAMIVERHRAEASRFDFDLIYWGWPILLGVGFGVAALVGNWGVGWAIFGFLFSAFAVAMGMARIKYGTATMRDVRRLLKRQPRS